ncbi:IS3 family transposase [Psychrobacillus sp. Sa2BUA9]|uniref:IS3 family transposase n=1 Tax=Psychrobacillus faecigallinarum TaxID=2762235 RepID=A0ABR8RF88_9BACI|nr:IS3 family transposase [Psychrobacillus faecigallinarum]MBD7946423.1 IS3 family transposase [Psychrobacillus faecigallinarum]
MGTRVSYPVEVKMKAIEMRLAKVPVKEVMEELNIRNKTQLKTWMAWYRNGEIHRLHQPVGKQYTFGKGPEYDSETARLQAENRFLEQQIEVFKKVRGIGKEVAPTVVIQLVEDLKDGMPVGEICRHLGVGRSSYYRWRKKEDQPTQKEIRDQQIGDMCKQHKFRYGYRKISALYPGVCEKTVQRIMQKYGWQCKVKVKKRKKTGQPAYVTDNLLARDFTATKPLERLVTDITYLPFGQTMMYLSSIKDLFNGEIIAYTIDLNQDTKLVIDTLNQLPEVTKGCILHSDQGSVYTSYAYQKAVKEKGITMSMSRKGTPADNSPIETFHSTLKSETFYLEDIYRTTNACVINIVKEYIIYYNNTRIQTKLNSQSPVQYRQSAA